MMKLNRRLPLPDLLLAQVQRRLDLTARPEPTAAEQDATIEVMASLVILGVAWTFVLVLWVLW